MDNKWVAASRKPQIKRTGLELKSLSVAGLGEGGGGAGVIFQHSSRQCMQRIPKLELRSWQLSIGGVQSPSYYRHGWLSVKTLSSVYLSIYRKSGMFAHTLNSAVLDLSVIPCLDNTATSPCVRALSYRCGDRAYGFSDVLHVQIQDKVVPLTPGPKFAIVGDLGVPHGRRTIDTIASRMSKTAVTNGKSGGGSAVEDKEAVQMLLHAGDICYAQPLRHQDPQQQLRVGGLHEQHAERGCEGAVHDYCWKPRGRTESTDEALRQCQWEELLLKNPVSIS